MDLVGQYLILFGLVGLLFLDSCSGKPSYSLTISYTLTSEPVEGLPQLVVKGYVDDQQIGFYDSNVMEALPTVPWMEKVLIEDPNFWMWTTQRIHTAGKTFRDDLKILQRRYNQTGRLHTWQRRFGCELSGAEVIDTFYQYAYDGKDFISLDVNTLTWTALDVEAQVIKRRWENMPFLTEERKAFLEEECVWRLQTFVECGKDALMRQDASVVKVTHKEINDEKEALVCQVYGFYPKDISTSWKRDGVDWEHETFRGIIAPNSDKTYYAWLSVEIDPKDRSRFHCHVEHVSLPETLIVGWERPEGSTLIFALGAILGVTFLLVAVAVIVIFMHRHTRRAVRDSKEQRELRLLVSTQSSAIPVSS